jgi:hypothetical protein
MFPQTGEVHTEIKKYATKEVAMRTRMSDPRVRPFSKPETCRAAAETITMNSWDRFSMEFVICTNTTLTERMTK